MHWVRVDAFQEWLDDYMQQPHLIRKSATPSSSVPTTPVRSRSTSGLLSKSATPVPTTPNSCTQKRARAHSRAASASRSRILPPIFEISDSEDVAPTPKTPQTLKRRRGTPHIKSEPEDVIILTDSDEDTHVTKRQRLPRIKTEPPSGDIIVLTDSDDDNDKLITITRQCRVKKLITLTSVPRCWNVPRDGEDTAYLLDLSNDPPEKWLDEGSGDPLSMAAIIKKEVSISIPSVV